MPIAFATALGAPKGQHPGLGVACLALAAAWLVWARAGPGVVAHVSDIPVYTPGILYTGIYLVYTKGNFAYLVYFTLYLYQICNWALGRAGVFKGGVFYISFKQF